MDARLSQAVAAARSGQTETAQQLLAELLEENPDEVQGWFLLSNLVDDPAQKQVFLGRVLTLDPDHALAQTQWQQLHASGPAAAQSKIAVSDSDDVVRQAEGDSLPNWLADDADNLRLDEQMMAPDETEFEPDETMGGAEPIPDWLQDDAALEEETVVATAAQDVDTAVSPPPRKAPQPKAPAAKRKPSSQERSLTVILYVLSGVAVLVFLALIYLVVINL